MANVLINLLFNLGRHLTPQIIYFFMNNNSAAYAQLWADTAKSFINNGISYAFNKDMNYNAYLQQLDLQERSQKFMSNMYNHTLAYNSPDAQLSRLKNAGINPNSAFGGVEGTTGNAQIPSSPGLGSAPSPAYMPYSVANTSFADYAKARKDTADAVRQEIQNEYADEWEQLGLAEKKELLKKYKAEIDELISQADLNKDQSAQLWQMLPLLMEKTRNESKEALANISKITAEVDRIDFEKAKIKQEIEVLKKQGESIEAQTQLTKLQSDLADLDAQDAENRAAYNAYMYSLGLNPDKVGYDIKNFGGILSTGVNAVDMVARKVGKGKISRPVPNSQIKRNRH